MSNVFRNAGDLRKELEFFNGPLYKVADNSPVVLEVSDSRRHIKVVNKSSFTFKNLMVMLVDEKGDRMPVFSFADMMEDGCQAFRTYDLYVPDETYNVIKNTFDKPSTYYDVWSDEEIYKKLTETNDWGMYVVPEKLHYEIEVPHWLFDAGAAIYVWHWTKNERESSTGHWQRCSVISDQRPRVITDLPGDIEGFLILRVIPDWQGSPSFEQGKWWNKSKDIYVADIAHSINNYGFSFYLGNEDFN